MSGQLSGGLVVRPEQAAVVVATLKHIIGLTKARIILLSNNYK